MEYLDKVLGVKVTYEDVEFKHLPNFIATRYRLQMVSMNDQKMIFLYPKTELEQIEVLKKHIARIQNNENLPIVLVLKELSFRQKEYLIREKIPFIVDGKQIYLPFMAGICRSRRARCAPEYAAVRSHCPAGCGIRCRIPCSHRHLIPETVWLLFSYAPAQCLLTASPRLFYVLPHGRHPVF